MTTQRGLALPVLACLFAALISVGAYIAIPLPGTPVPIVLQNLFIMLAALLLGPTWGLAALGVYLVLGALGLPVFSGGTGGFARFLGPTGGYLLGYIPAVLAMGLVSRLGEKRRWWRDALALLLGSLIVYACGVPWLKAAIKGSWEKALAGGLLPFLPGDAIKIILAVLLAGRLAPLVERVAPRRKADDTAAAAEGADGGRG
ncbi:MAG: biotin transporter BioY [Spirochaetaceae bacterium]|nr:biotin transporter BioY [Spirochaetaceae bacterium]